MRADQESDFEDAPSDWSSLSDMEELVAFTEKWLHMMNKKIRNYSSYHYE